MSVYDNNQISRYLSGELSPEELQQFEADLQEDKALADEVEKCREALALLQDRLPEDPTAKALRAGLTRMNEIHFKAETKVIPFRKYMFAATAAAVIIFTIVLWPTQSYMEEWGNITMISSTQRGAGANTALQSASVFFNRKEYARALPLLNQAVKADSSSQMALFYRGVTEFHVGDKEASRRDLEKVFEGSSIFKYEAAFFLAVGYASDKEKEKSLEWLTKIPAGTPVSEKAEKLKASL